MDKKEKKAKEYADWSHKLVEEFYQKKCAEHDFYYKKADIQLAFQAGWDEALKNKWIKAKDELPKLYERVLVMFEYEGEVQIHDHTYMGGNFIYGASKIIAWMPIPSFDDILRDNKDVLKRLKDK